MVRTFRFARFDGAMLLVHDQRRPSSDEWSTWVEAYARATLEHGMRRLLVVSKGGGPDARQRKEVIAAITAAQGDAVEEMRTAVCGDAGSVRVITAAIGWLSSTPHLKSFGYRERDRALAYLGVSVEQRGDIVRAAKLLEDELAGRRAVGF